MTTDPRQPNVVLPPRDRLGSEPFRSGQRHQGPRIGLVATMPRSGTWYNNSFFYFYVQLLEGKEDLSVIKTSINLSLSDPRQLLGVRYFMISHMICPGFADVRESDRSPWKTLRFVFPGFDWGTDHLHTLCQQEDCNPLRNANVRIVYYYRNPLDQAVSMFGHYQNKRRAPLFYRDETGKEHCIDHARTYLFHGGLESYIKQYYTFYRIKTLCPDNLLMIPYETLVRRPAETFLRVLAFLGHDIGNPAHRERIAIALKLSSKGSLTRMEKRFDRGASRGRTASGSGGKHILDGSIGRWRQCLSQDDLKQVDQQLSSFGLHLRDFHIV